MSALRMLNNRFTRVVLVGVALVFAVVIVRPFLTEQQAQEDIGAMAAAQQLALAGYVARDVDYKLIERQTALTHMAATLPVALLGQPVPLRQWLADQYRLQPLFTQGLLVTDSTGQPIADYPQHPERMRMRYGDRDYIRSSLAGAMAIGRPTQEQIAKEPALPMAVPVTDASGTVRAVLVGVTALKAPGFLSLNPHTVADENADFMLVSPHDHLFLASTQANLVLQPTPATGVDALLDRAMGGYRGTELAENASGVEEVAAIASVHSTGWFVVARKPSADALRAVANSQTPTPLTKQPMVLALLLLITVGGLIFALQPSFIMHRLGHFAAPVYRLLTRLQPNPSKMAHMAHHDALTGLPNRALLEDRLGQALARAHRKGKRVGLLTIDLDHFKSINHALGNDAGDTALEEVARRLEEVVRESDTLARVGGDQFAVVMEELDGEYAAAELAACAVAAKCLDAVLPAITLKGSAHQLGASAGIALSDEFQSQEALQVASHYALQEAKRAGGDRYFVAALAAIPAKPAIANA